MTLTLEQFNKLASEKKPKGLAERVNKKFEIALNKAANKSSVKKTFMESEERLAKKFDKILSILDNLAKQHEIFKIELAKKKRAGLLRRKKLLKDGLL